VQAAIKNAGLPLSAPPAGGQPGPAACAKKARPTTCPLPWAALIASGQLAPDRVERAMVVGELSLDGSLRHVRGVLPMAAVARQEGFQRLYVPEADAAEAALVPGLEVYPVPSGGALRPTCPAPSRCSPTHPDPGKYAHHRPDRLRRGQGPGARQTRSGSSGGWWA